jgi:RimJ/RimL family protein N-acetyltransferase
MLKLQNYAIQGNQLSYKIKKNKLCTPHNPRRMEVTEKIQIVHIDNGNIDNYIIFERLYEESLQAYQSRIHPRCHEDYQQLFEENMLLWYYIVYDDKYIGSVWLEKLLKNDSSATLGIFIYDNKFRGLGIGQKTIKNIIIQGCDSMHFLQIELNVRADNMRAISCYKNCGFIESDKYMKNGIDVIHMIHALAI